MKNHLFSKLGIPIEVIEKLFKMGVHTAEDFLKKAKTKRKRVMLSQLLHVPEKNISRWVNRLDFLRLGNMSHEIAEMFHRMGFGSIASLRHISAEALHKAMNVFNHKHDYVKPHLIPNLEDIKKWIKIAEEKELKIFGFQFPEIHKKLEKKPEPKIKITDYKKIFLYLLAGIFGLFFIFLFLKNIKIFLGILGFTILFLGIYLRFGKNPFPKIKAKIQNFLTKTSEKIKYKFKKLSFKLDEINRKFDFYRKHVGTFFMILPIILGFLYLLNFSFKFPNLDFSRYLPQKNTEIQNIKGFKDVQESDFYFEAISFLSKKGLIDGYEDQTFRPKEPIKRGELVKILVSSLNLEDKEIYQFKNCFSDVQTQWFAPFICYGEEKSWIHGYEAGDFKPQKEVTRAESLKMILNVFEINNIASVTEDVALDVKSYDWFAPFVAYAKESKIIELEKKENFEPHKSITRGEVSEYIYRVLKMKEIPEK